MSPRGSALPRFGDIVAPEHMVVEALREENAALLEKNAALIAGLSTLKSALAAGHLQLSESLTALLKDAEQAAVPETSLRKSERHVAAYLSFLAQAKDVAAGLAADAQPPPRHKRQSWCSRLMCCASASPNSPPSYLQIAPPTSTTVTPRSVELNTNL